MRARIFTFAAILTALYFVPELPAEASPKPSLTPHLLAEQSWTQFSPPSGSFIVLMPGSPKEDKETEKNSDSTTESYTYTVETSIGAFLVGYTDFSDDISSVDSKRLLDAAAQGFTTNGGKLLSQQNLSMNGHPGREVNYTDRDGTTSTARIFIVKQRLYQLHAISSQSQDVKKFFDSFKLVKKA
jgi:hypothetical protein